MESGSFAYDFSADLGRDEWKPTSVSICIFIWLHFLFVQFKLRENKAFSCLIVDLLGNFDSLKDASAKFYGFYGLLY